jgi:hypothetical protein
MAGKCDVEVSYQRHSLERLFKGTAVFDSLLLMESKHQTLDMFEAS